MKIELRLTPAEAADEKVVKRKAAQSLGLDDNDISALVSLRRSIDARGSRPMVELQLELFINGRLPEPAPALLSELQHAKAAPSVIIVGAGPAGYFAALELLTQGIKPIVLDRGLDVRARRRDLKSIQQDGVVNPHSNYCFGEGGAGTYSDGKLYTRSKKRGEVDRVLKLLVEHGASPDILVEAHPHIGSNKLPGVVANIRETIVNYGGEVRFEHFVTDFILKKGKIQGVVVNDNVEILADAVILATGHSARDIFYLLNKRNIRIEAKPFALGVRIEHPQPLIDKIQYGQPVRDPLLPASSYRLACQVDGRGVFSFCMCPGGLIVPASTAPGELVVNGMSMSRRDSPYANSGLVVAVELDDLAPYKKFGVFAALEFQKEVEHRMFTAGDGTQKSPAQRVTDFVKSKMSSSLNGTSYIPGIFSAPMTELLPTRISSRLQQGLVQFGKSMKGYFTEEANLIGAESRTSSPIRIPRDPASFMHPEVVGLYPCGEGAGYAGGIVSAAMDGINVAKKASLFLR